MGKGISHENYPQLPTQLQFLRSRLGKVAFKSRQNGLDYALHALRTVEGHDQELRLFAAWCARQVQHLMANGKSLHALNVVERFALGVATEKELSSARDAAKDAAKEAAWYAGRTSSWASIVASTQALACVDARDAAWSSARDAAGFAAWSSAWYSAWYSARAASWGSAGDAAREAQKSKLIEICEACK